MSEKYFAMLRRYAQAIAEGLIEAKTVSTMTDAELETFDAELAEKLDEKQAEAERLAGE